MTWNRKMLTTEDCNSVLQHFGKCFIDYFVVDTRLLETEDSTFAYDFITITRTTGTIDFNIKNELWTGAYKILDCTSGVTPTVSVSNNIITVSGTGLTYVKLELELSPHFKHDTVFEYDYKVKYENPVIVPFYETADLTVQFLDDDTPVANLSVYDPLNDITLTTDSNGEVTVTSDWDKPGDYLYPLQISNNGETVLYNFPYSRLKADLPFKLSNNIQLIPDKVYRSTVNMLLFDFKCTNTEAYSVLNSDDFVLKYNGKEYTGYLYNNSIDFKIPVGDVDSIEFDFIIDGSQYLNNNSYHLRMDAVYVTCSSLDELQDNIVLYDYSVIRFTGDGELLFGSPISVEHDVKIIFTDTVSVVNNDQLFIVKNGACLKLVNLDLEAYRAIVELVDGCVELVDCNISHVLDTVIYGNGDVTLSNCGFIDNLQVLDVEGNVTADNTLFDLSDTEYLNTDKLPFLDVYGDLNINYCNFNLELTGLDSLGYSYVCCKIGEEYSTNNVNNNKLFTNESFPIGNNNCNISVESTNYRVTSKSNKSFTWNMVNTNTVFSNKLNVEHIGD